MSPSRQAERETDTLAALLADSDGESVICGPQSDDEVPDVVDHEEPAGMQSENGSGHLHMTVSLVDTMPTDAESSTTMTSTLETESFPQVSVPPGVLWPWLIRHKGEVKTGQKFICVFQVKIEEDPDFCLVKRILGKQGNNMRSIAEECNVKVRLRGRGSGFLEGSHGKETNMPLNLNVSCSDFESYSAAVERVAILLNDIYRHYRRYRKSLGLEVPELKVHCDEMRRDDLDLNMLVKPVKLGNVPAPQSLSSEKVEALLNHLDPEIERSGVSKSQAVSKAQGVNQSEGDSDGKVHTERVWIYDKECGRVIGRGGDNLRDIMTKTHTEIKISQRTGDDTGAERCAEISGPAVGRQMAIQMILSEVTYCRSDDSVIKKKAGKS